MWSEEHRRIHIALWLAETMSDSSSIRKALMKKRSMASALSTLFRKKDGTDSSSSSPAVTSTTRHGDDSTIKATRNATNRMIARPTLPCLTRRRRWTVHRWNKTGSVHARRPPWAHRARPTQPISERSSRRSLFGGSRPRKQTATKLLFLLCHRSFPHAPLVVPRP